MITRCVYKCIRSGKCEHNRYWYRCLAYRVHHARLSFVCVVVHINGNAVTPLLSPFWLIVAIAIASVLNSLRDFLNCYLVRRPADTRIRNEFCWYLSSSFSCVFFSFRNRSGRVVDEYVCVFVPFNLFRCQNGKHSLTTQFSFFIIFIFFFVPQFVFRNSDLARRKARVWRAGERERARAWVSANNKKIIYF